MLSGIRSIMSENVVTVIVMGGLFVGLPVALLFARDWLARPSRKKLEEYSRQFTQRLQAPDFPALEKHFGCALPQAVRALYADKQEVMRQDFMVAATAVAPEDGRWYVAFYQPADEQNVQDAWPGLEKYFAFADDGSGNGYLIDPKEADPPVLFHDHETGEMSPVSRHFTEFMRWPRLEVKG
jgi:hypothetical protein